MNAAPDNVEDELKKDAKPKKTSKTKKRSRRAEADDIDEAEESEEQVRKDDEVLKALGPQTMALLAAGQGREDSLEDEPEEPVPIRRRKGTSFAGRAKRAGK